MLLRLLAKRVVPPFLGAPSNFTNYGAGAQRFGLDIQLIATDMENATNVEIIHAVHLYRLTKACQQQKLCCG